MDSSEISSCVLDSSSSLSSLFSILDLSILWLFERCHLTNAILFHETYTSLLTCEEG